MKKTKISIILLLLLCLCSACGSTANNSETEANNTTSVQANIPESALEIIDGIGIEVDLQAEVPEISLYAYSDDTASEVYTFVCLVNGLLNDVSIPDYKIFIYSDEEVIETSVVEMSGATGTGDASMPVEWLNFIEEKEIGNGSVTIGQFVSQETIDVIEEKLQTNVFDVLAEQESESAENAGQETEGSEKNISKQEIYYIGDDEISLMLFESDGENYFLVTDTTDNEEKASLFFAYFLDMFSKMEDTDIDSYCITVLCNEKSVNYLFAGDIVSLYGTNNDGTVVSTLPDWLVTDMEGFTMPASEMEEFLLEVQGAVEDFTANSEGGN